MAASALTIFDHWADARLWLKWSELVTNVTLLTTQEIGVGSRFRVQFPIGTSTYQIITYDRPTRITFAVTEGGISDDINYTIQLAPENHGTRTCNRFSVRLKGIRLLLAPTLYLSLRRRVRVDLADTRRYVEAISR